MSRLIVASVLLAMIPAGLRAEDPSKALIDGIAVDEAGEPVAGATVRARCKWWLRPDVKAISGADGRFRLELDTPIAICAAVYAATPDGARQGRQRAEFTDLRRTVDCRIVLKAAAAVRVTVVDAAGVPVSDAVVALDDASEMLAHAATDDTGTVRLRVPADAKVGVVVGFKGGVGFDYFENYNTSEGDLMPVPAAVKLVLSGARTVRMRAVDSADRPLAGIRFCPSLMSRPGKVAWVVSTTFLFALAETGVLPCSGADGIAVCDWFPVELKRATPFEPIDPGFRCPEWPYFDRSTTTVQPARLLRVVKARGHVTGLDGAPAAGVLVQADGRGPTSRHRTFARTATDGTYALELHPDQGYVVAVVDPEQAAPKIMGVVIREDRTRTDLDFCLGPGTLVEGRVTAGPSSEPVATTAVYLRTLGTPLPAELSREIQGLRPELTRSAYTDSTGHYRLRVAPGEYQIAGPDRTFSDLNIGPQASGTLRRDFHLPRVSYGPLEVFAHDPDGTPAAGATLLISACDDARTDDGGRFRGRRSRRAPALIYAGDPSRGTAGIATIGPDDERATLTLRPAATATGRVLGADGRPRADCSVTVIIRPAAGGTPEQYVRRATYSGPGGSFILTGLAEGTTCDIKVCSAMRCGVNPVKTFEVKGPAPIDLGDLPLPPDE